MRGDTEISNTEDLINSRDVIDRIQYLEDEQERAENQDEWNESDEGQELKALQTLQEDAEGYCDWAHGATLINDDYFEDYAQEFAEEIGAIGRATEWPCTCIDWEKAADELKMDYTSVEFNGVTYWVR